MARPLDKKPKIIKQHNLQREFFFHTGIYFKDLVNAKELNKNLLKHIKTWKKRDEKGSCFKMVHDNGRNDIH